MPKFHNNTDALVWLDTSAEQCALYLQAFALARLRIEAILNPSPESKIPKPDPASLCVFTDCDETLLDNSEYNAWLVFTGRNFATDTWDAYCKDKRSRACSGAVEFTNWLKTTEIQLFYVTSRSNRTRRETVENMRSLEFPLDDDDLKEKKEVTRLFMADMNHPNGTKDRWDKWPQYQWIEDNRKVTPQMWLGDNLSDFQKFYKDERWDSRLSQAESEKPAKLAPDGTVIVPAGDRKNWGLHYIVMPNPVYGAFLNSYKSKVDGHLLADDSAGFVKQSVVVREPVLPHEAPKLTELEVWPKF